MKKGRSIDAPPFFGARFLWISVPLAFYLVIALVFVFWGGFVGDEGYYALMSRNIADGLKPYRDFFCPQMPLLYYTYAGWFSLVGPGIVNGRLLSAMFGAASVILVAYACLRRGGKMAGLIGGLLIACNPHIIFDSIEIKTQSLSLLLASGLVFVLAKREIAHPLREALLALLLGNLMFFTRLSLLPSLVVLWAVLGWRLRQAPGAFALLLAGNFVVLAASLSFFSADGSMLFGVYRVHSEYWGGGDWSFARLGVTMKSWIGNQLPIIVLFISAIGVFLASCWRSLRTRTALPNADFLVFLLFSYWGYTFLHWSSVQSYATHQTVVAGFAVVFSMTVLAPILEKLYRESRMFCTVAFAALLCLPMPFGEWGFNLNGNNSIGRTREALSVIGKYAGKNDSILTFNVELAVDGGYKIPVECAMGDFSYIPNMPDKLCEKYRMMNLRMLVSAIESGRHRILCMGNREFAIMAGGDQKLAGQLKELIDRKYIQVGSVNNYGQFNQELFIFAAKY